MNVSLTQSLNGQDLWLIWTGAGSRTTSMSTARTKVAGPVAQSTTSPDSCQVLWQIVLVAKPRPNQAIAKSTGAGGGHVSGSVAGPLGHKPAFSKYPSMVLGSNGLYDLLSGFQSSHNGIFVHGYLPDYCY